MRKAHIGSGSGYPKRFASHKRTFLFVPSDIRCVEFSVAAPMMFNLVAIWAK